MSTVLPQEKHELPGYEETQSSVYAFVGNPNCGKTTIFNSLTGLRQKVGNYPGVTVEKKMGEFFSQHGKPLKIIDLPGSYSLAARSPDEAILRDVLYGRRADTPRPGRVVCIVDASNLERNLYLVHQVFDLGLPTILVLNMMDIAAKSGLTIDVTGLEKRLGIPVIACEANTGKGLLELRIAMSRAEIPCPTYDWVSPKKVEMAIAEISDRLLEGGRHSKRVARAESLLLLTEQESIRVQGSSHIVPEVMEAVLRWESGWKREGYDWRGGIVAARYDAISELCRKIVKRQRLDGPSLSDRIDAVTVHPVWGWLILGGIMSVLFLSIFTLANYPMDLIDGWVSSLANWVKGVMPAGDLEGLVTDGIISGVGGIVIFLPQILILFFFIGLLESTGYMARAAFIMDRLMSRVGLNGKSFIPLLGSYACAIPGIMATRTIEEPKDRLVTILVAPLMSCSARLPVYLLLITALVPSDRVPVMTKVGLMVGMYFLGTAGAFAFAWLFKKFLLRGETPLMIMELPPYRVPSLKSVSLHMMERALLFLKRAGTIILGISIILWFLTTYPKTPDATTSTEAISQSFAGTMGKVMEPVIEPLGFDWRIGIGLISSFAAREVFVSAMAIIYSVDQEDDEDTQPFREALLKAAWPDGRPVFTPLVCLSLMVFYVFAMQCMSTIAVVKRETNGWKWPLFQTGYMTIAAYLASLFVYQGGLLLGF